MRVLDTRLVSIPTDAQYQAGLLAVRTRMTDKQFRMLRHHYLSPEGSATQRQLAIAVGYANYGGANLQYGRREYLCPSCSAGLEQKQSRAAIRTRFNC